MRRSLVQLKSRRFLSGGLAFGALVLVALALTTGGAPAYADDAPPPVQSPELQDRYLIIGWNDLGMHCLDDRYEVFSILPPYNTMWSQVVRIPANGGEPQVVTSGVTVNYSVQDNTYSAGKVNFWNYAQALFNLPEPLPVNVGLTGKGLAGDMDPASQYFEAVGVPLTPYNDSAPSVRQPYQLANLVASRTGTGELLAETTIVAPVSDEMRCDNCHHDGGVGGISTGDYRLNILTYHDDESGTNLVGSQPVLCASCHASPALGTPGQPGVKYLSHSMHEKHAGEDGVVINTMAASWLHSTGTLGAPPRNPEDGTEDCYQCHPGVETACLRDTMSSAGMWCTNCHGDMRAVGSEDRIPWVDEPKCGDSACHGPQYAENPNTLYRNSTGHGGLYCEACHNSTHAILPSREVRDNLQTIALQGYAGTLTECTVCHGLTVPNGQGPHGMACTLSADVDDDGDVDVTDIQLNAGAWLVEPVNPVYDQNRDGVVDVSDIMLVARSFGAVCQT
ncbi:MAG: hypothetical protein H6649_07820 [Caldilineae bacterium]|nr:hypothetical protein [Caldilineae bacterium]